ncbi:hypothetical protein P2L35_13190 [Enterococcus faecium]|nr:hypothetical protein [Enterococcus faecium]
MSVLGDVPERPANTPIVAFPAAPGPLTARRAAAAPPAYVLEAYR